jgi:single-stranded DNA-binding protein
MKAMGKNANFLRGYVGIGDMVYIEAEPDFSKYTKKDGTTAYGSSFIVQNVKSLAKSSKAKRDKDGNLLPPEVIDKTGEGKKQSKSKKEETVEYDYSKEKDLLEEETGTPTSDEESEDSYQFDIDDLDI